MKRLLAGLIVVGMSFYSMGGVRDSLWRDVDQAVGKGLPKTAITNLDSIIVGALRDKAYAEATKAIGKKIVLEGNIQGNKPEEKVTRMETEIAKAPKEMVPIMDTLLAHWYWHYFQQNRWRFMQRTATAQSPGKDFTTWDLPRLFAEINRKFQSALKAETLLKAQPVGKWDDLLQKGTMPDAYRPTLFDFIAFEALSFYASGEQAGAKPEDAFELSANSPVLDSIDKFLAWKPETQDTNSPIYQCVRLYQDLLRFHQADPEPRPALAHADLERLTWAWNASFGEEKNSRYKGALESFIQQFADDAISALAYEREARVLQSEDDFVGARKVALRGAELFPKSPGGILCRNLVKEIEAKSASIQTEHVWNCFPGNDGGGACPEITITYRNVDKVYFRAIPYDWEVFLQKQHNRPENLSDAERREILGQKPELEWSENLSPTGDYQETTVSLAAPTKLKPGFYFIVASHDPAFGEKENLVSLADVWVSDLALITRTHEGMLEGFVLNADSGEPIAGASVDVWHLDNQANRATDPVLTTDANGFFTMTPAQNRGYLLRARHDGRQVATLGDLYAYNRPSGDPRPSAQTVLFTDRAIYRPGQTIQYKGICLWVDQKQDNYEVLKGEEVTVIFRDVNGKEIARQKRQANDYGSFSGSFTAPRDRLMGQMSLHVDGRARGTAMVHVEEYKRPKFEVTLDAPKTAPKLNEKVNVRGMAVSFTGAPVDGGQVKYRVTRVVRMPWWWGWGWRGGRPGQESQEIAHGSVRTANDGSFQIEFLAKPDPEVLEKDEPTFDFQVHADVTDSAGETRSADRIVQVGYTALQATVNVDDWQVESKPVEVSIHTSTLDGSPQVTEGKIRIQELTPPSKPQRPRLGGPVYPVLSRRGPVAAGEPEKTEDLSDPNGWPLGKVIVEEGFTTDTNGAITKSFQLPAGQYRAVLETQDRFGKRVTGMASIRVLNPDAPKLGIRVPHLVAAPSWSTQPGSEFMALWGTGYEEGRAFIEVEHQRRMIQRFWTRPGQTQQQIRVATTEAMRGGFTIHVTQVRENRAYLDTHRVEVPWSNKDLDLRWEHFVSKLQPGQKETWTLVVSAPAAAKPKEPGAAEKAVAEMAAALYDESLDAFASHNWMQRFGVFRQDYSTLQSQFCNFDRPFQPVFGGWSLTMEGADIRYRSFPEDLTQNFWGYGFPMNAAVRRKAIAGGRVEALSESVAAPMAMELRPTVVTGSYIPEADRAGEEKKAALDSSAPQGPKVDLSGVAARKNLNETAFFFPQLTSDSNGVVRITFAMPEALTKWRFLGFAHDRELRSGYLEAHAVTAKDLMVQPNPPRFLREGDTVEFTVKVTNQSDQPQEGSVRLNFFLASTEEPADKLLGNNKPELSFQVPAKESRTYSWRITVPDGCGFLTYKAVGASRTVSDGEEGAVPVLSRRILVTESLPLPIRGPATRKFEFTKLLKSGDSKTLQNQSLTVQLVSNPAWYAVLALPYLMEYPYECSEQVFNRLYANLLARTIASSDPRIRRVFDQWKNTPALDSPLEKNQDLKSVSLEETPWLRQAQDESQARRNVGVLFDENRLNSETESTLRKLAEMQLPDGSWPWFPGGRGNDFITLYITTGFGRLRHLGVDINPAPAVRSLRRLDAWMAEHYAEIQRSGNPERYVPSSTDALYLYGRSFFLKDQPIAPPHKTAVDFFLQQSRKFWLQTNNRQTQGHLALALARFNAISGGTDTVPADIMKSLKERSVSNEELGMFWRDTELSWWWYRAPIETQALMIEAFDEVAKDSRAVEDCRVWLLKQKQTQDWKTTKATADAVYALLLRGKDILSSRALVELTVGGMNVTPDISGGGGGQKSRTAKSASASPVEPGTGFYEVRFAQGAIKPKLGEITVKKTDEGVAWGSMHWQYLEDMTKVTPYEGTPLRLKKTLFRKVNTGRGQVLEPISGPLGVGDELVVRVELRSDRDMEYVHLKDQRGSGTEPVNVNSRYRYQDGLAYYESTRDTASHFFIDYLPKGTYVFEYSTRIQLRGDYQTGIAEIQCMYAPEFNSHSGSVPLSVK